MEPKKKRPRIIKFKVDYRVPKLSENVIKDHAKVNETINQNQEQLGEDLQEPEEFENKPEELDLSLDEIKVDILTDESIGHEQEGESGAVLIPAKLETAVMSKLPSADIQIPDTSSNVVDKRQINQKPKNFKKVVEVLRKKSQELVESTPPLEELGIRSEELDLPPDEIKVDMSSDESMGHLQEEDSVEDLIPVELGRHEMQSTSTAISPNIILFVSNEMPLHMVKPKETKNNSDEMPLHNIKPIETKNDLELTPNTISSNCNCDDNCVLKLKMYDFKKFSVSDKIRLIEKGRPTPPLEIIPKETAWLRHFNSTKYDEYKWLMGCRHTIRLFCFPCILYFHKTTPNVWIDKGFKILKNFDYFAKKHENSEQHLEACTKLQLLRNNTQTSLNSDQKLDTERHNAKVNKLNKKVFQRLIDILCFIGKQDLDLNQGFFLETAQFLAKYDNIMENQLLVTTGPFAELSNKLQTDLIWSITSAMEEVIKQQIRQADFIALMIDGTPSRKQLVIVLRYNRGSKIVDRFLKYIDFSPDIKVEILTDTIMQILDDYGCVTKLIAHTCDGSRLPSSFKLDIQNKLREKCPDALVVWCSEHVFGSILSESLETISETKHFFSQLKAISIFFNCDLRRHAYNKLAVRKQLPTISENQWNYSSNTVHLIFNNINLLTKLFQDIEKNSSKWDGETLMLVSIFLNNFKDFRFRFFLKIFHEIYAVINTLECIIKKETYDLETCLGEIYEFESFLQKFKYKFKDIYCETMQACGLNVLCLSDYYQQILIKITDHILNLSCDRYSCLKDLVFCKLLLCENYKKYSLRFCDDLITTLLKKKFKLERLRNELKTIYKSEAFQNLDVYQTIQFIDENNLQAVFPQVLQMARLILIIPVTSASIKKSFLCLERIHANLSSFPGQRLNELAMISIEKHLLAEMQSSSKFYDDILQHYLKKNKHPDLTD